MNRFRLLALFPFILGSLADCTVATQGTLLPDGFAVRELSKADAGAPIAASGNGRLAAISKGTLLMIGSDGVARELAQGAATALCFSPGGEKLAAALPAQGHTFLRLFDRQGRPFAEATIPETITSMTWRSESQLLAAALGVGNVEAGCELTSLLYLWDGLTPPVATTLSRVTVPPAEAKRLEHDLLRTLSLDISPYGDEIAYGSLKTRPNFAPYQSIAVRRLEDGAEREVGKTSVGSGGPLYTPDGESLLVGDDHALTRRLSIPDGREIYAWPAPGDYPAISPSGAFTFLDGRVYENGRTLFSFPTRSRGAFLPDGSGLAVSYDGKLYLLSGLKDQAPGPRANLEQLLRLRRLRSLGLISEQEYRRQKAGL